MNMTRERNTITEGRYTFHTEPNSYFQGRDLRVSDNETGRTILVNIKGDMWAVNVKDDVTRHAWPVDVQKAADEIGDTEVETAYQSVQSDFWDWASSTLATDHDFETTYQEGQSGGWLAVPGSTHAFPEIIDPDSPEARKARDDFLALAFEADAEIEETYRPEFYAAVTARWAELRRESEIEEAFLTGYMECALWSSTDPDTEQPLDDKFSIGDIDEDTVTKMRVECHDFIELNRYDINRAVELLPERDWSSMGHDFWLTRNGHGAGFWDRTSEAPPSDRDEVKPILERLSKAARETGERYLAPTSDTTVGAM